MGINRVHVYLVILIIGLAAFGAGVWFNSGFEYEVSSVVAIAGSPVSPDYFVNGSNSGVTVGFSYDGDSFEPGRHELKLSLRRGLRSHAATAVLYSLEPLDYLNVELTSAAQPQISPLDFFANQSILSDIPVDVVRGLIEFEWEIGEYPVEIYVNGHRFDSAVRVVDTTGPVLETEALSIRAGDEVMPENFVVSGYDTSGILDIRFAAPPDIFTEQTSFVEIIGEDVFGNTSSRLVALAVLANDVPPTIIGAEDIEIMVGGNIMFRAGVSAEDAFGRPLEFVVDNTQVDIGTPGVYTVTYSTIDEWGNTADVDIVVHVINVDPEWIHEQADIILQRILREGMTQVEEARAIFDWLQANLRNTGDIRRDSIYEAAYAALTNRQGNCFVYFSLSHVMLTRAGIPSIRIDRIPGSARTLHRWNLINPDGLGWHHFDATPAPIAINRFMFTSSEARRHTERMERETGRVNYYLYDPDLYPEIVQ